MKCERCGNDVNDKTAWHEVKGYEQARAAGGTNHVKQRQRTGKVVCHACMTLAQSGIHVGQQTLA